MAGLQRSNAVTETSQELMGLVPLLACRNEDGSVIAAAASAGKFGIVAGGWGTGGLKLQGEAASGNSKTSGLIFTGKLPQNYVAGTNLSVKIKHRVSTPANTTANIDAGFYESNGNGGVTGSDLVTTSATTYNSATWTETTFSVTGTGLNPGDQFELHVRMVVDDSAGATGARSELGEITIESSTKM